MAISGVDKVVEKWLSDSGFKTRLLNNPEDAVKSCGVTLSQDEWSTLRNVMLSNADEQLATRISKGWSN